MVQSGTNVKSWKSVEKSMILPWKSVENGLYLPWKNVKRSFYGYDKQENRHIHRQVLQRNDKSLIDNGSKTDWQDFLH